MASEGAPCFNRVHLRRTLFYAARDGMSRVICCTFSGIPKEDLCEIVEQEVGDNYGQILTPLIIACKNGHEQVVKILLSTFIANMEHEGCVKMENYLVEGATPLWCAAGAGHLNIVKILVRAGADVNHATANLSTPIRAACYDGRLDIVRYLAAHGADINQPNKYNNSCLMIASYQGHLDIVRFLLENDANPNVQAHCGATALLFAAECGYREIVEELIKYGALLLPTNKGITPLIAAAERTQAHIVEYLLAKFAFTRREQIDALELLGASFANDKENYCLTRAYLFLFKAMALRYNGDEHILKEIKSPIPAYDNWVESQDVYDVMELSNNENGLHMESLAIRERILGSDNPEVPRSIIFRGAVFADHGRFDRCLALWLHALEISQTCKVPLFKDLRRFSQIFSQMVNDNVNIPFHIISYIFEIAVAELEKNKIKLISTSLKDERSQAEEELELNVITILFLIVILSKLLDDQNIEDMFKIHKLLYKLIKMKTCTRNGQSLLHLSVNAETPVDNYHTSALCRFPCASTAKLLVKCGADVNAIDKKKRTPLHTIVSYQKPLSDFGTIHSIIQDLIEAGAHIDAVNCLGETPLEAAKTGVAELLIRTRSSPSLKCLAAREVAKIGVIIDGSCPKCLLPFIEMHSAFKLVTHAEKLHAI